MKSTLLNTTFNIYLLYPTNRDDEVNFYKLLQDYINIGTEIYAYLIDWEKMDGLPKFKLYVPANHEVFIQSAYKSKFLTKEQIFFINCKIIETCNLLILFGDCVKFGDNKEIEYAKQKKIPIYVMPSLSFMAIDALKLAVKLIIKAED